MEKDVDPCGLPSLRTPRQQLSTDRTCRRSVPELQVNRSLNTGLRNKVVVEQAIRYGSNEEQEEACCCEEGSPKVSLLSLFGDGGMEGDQSCVLTMSAIRQIFEFCRPTTALLKAILPCLLRSSIDS